MVQPAQAAAHATAAATHGRAESCGHTEREKGRVRAHRAAWKAQVDAEDRFGIGQYVACAVVITVLVLAVIGCFTVLSSLLG